jgi:hypothetical protein
MGAKSKGRYTHLCYQGQCAIPMLFFSIMPLKLIYFFVLNSFLQTYEGGAINCGKAIYTFYAGAIND